MQRNPNLSKREHRRRWIEARLRAKCILSAGSVTELGFGSMAILDTDSAEAFGFDRAVSRPCGQNWVSSYGDSSSGAAATSTYSGNCQDKLVAGLNITGVVYWNTGSSPRSEVTKSGKNLCDATGRHQGCPTCAVTLS